MIGSNSNSTFGDIGGFLTGLVGIAGEAFVARENRKETQARLASDQDRAVQRARAIRKRQRRQQRFATDATLDALRDSGPSLVRASVLGGISPTQLLLFGGIALVVVFVMK